MHLKTYTSTIAVVIKILVGHHRLGQWQFDELRILQNYIKFPLHTHTSLNFPMQIAESTAFNKIGGGELRYVFILAVCKSRKDTKLFKPKQFQQHLGDSHKKQTNVMCFQTWLDFSEAQKRTQASV